MGLKIFEKAWTLRLQQENEQFLDLFSKIRLERNFPLSFASESQVESALQVHGLEAGTELLLLTGSGLRLRGENKGAIELLSWMENIYKKRALPWPFRLLHQQGLNHYYRGDYSKALDAFLAAHEMTGNSLHRLLALMDALFCFENLGLSYETTIKDVEKIIQTLSTEEKHNKDVASHLVIHRRRLHALQERFAFRNGNFKALFEELSEVKDAHDYFRVYWAQLPFQTYYPKDGLQNLIESTARISSFFYQKDYRTRTLQGLLHPDDYRNPKPSDWVDRLYSWTWRWMSEPLRFPLAYLMLLLQQRDPYKIWHRLTAEDNAMLRNALGWLSVFDVSSHNDILLFLNRLGMTKRETFPLFDFEFLMIRYFWEVYRTKKVENSILKSLQSHPLWGNSDLLFSDIILGFLGKKKNLGHLAGFVANLKKLYIEQDSKISAYVVDLDFSRIFIRRQKKWVYSASLAKALALFSKTSSVSFEEVTRRCFGMPNFDSLVHAPKIFALLTRLRKICQSDFVFTSRDGVVFLDGDSKNIFVRQRPSVSFHLGSQNAWRKILSPPPLFSEAVSSGERMKPVSVSGSGPGSGVSSQPLRSSISNLRSASVLKGVLLKRQEVEHWIRASKSSVHRILSRLEKKGLVIRTGRARGTVYKFSKEGVEYLYNRSRKPWMQEGEL